MFRLLWILFLAWGLGCASLAAQTGEVNPFDLRFRLRELVTSAVTPSASGLSVAPNPFDVVSHRLPGQTAVIKQKETHKNGIWRSLPRGKSSSKTFLMWTLIGIFGFLALSIAANRMVVTKAWKAFMNDTNLSIAEREATGIVGVTPYFMLYINFLLNAGLFAFLVTRYFKGDTLNNPYFLLVCIAVSFAIFLFKHFLISAVGWLFSIGKETGRYNFLIMVFNCILGLFLLAFNILIAFSAEMEPFLVFWTLGLVFVFYGYRALRSATTGSKFIVSDKFHFLLYLCAVEIAPVLLLFKIAMLQSDFFKGF